MKFFFVISIVIACFLPSQHQVQANTGVDCTFEQGFCGWTQSSTDQFNWTRHSGATRSPDTGPSVDHTNGTGSGYYIYIEVTGKTENDSARIVSPQLSATNGTCLSFWYHMYGNEINRLSVDINTARVWTLVGQQGNLWEKKWINFRSNVSFIITFEGIAGPGFKGDIALDDVTVKSGYCDIIGFSRSSVTVAETAGQVTVCLTIEDHTAVRKEVRLSTDNNTAKAPEDYTSLTGYNVTFAANETNRCVDLVIKDDNVTEYNETFYIKMTTNDPLLNLKVDRKILTVLITSDDQATIGFNNSSLSVHEGTGDVTVCMAKEGETAIPLDIGLTTVDSTAKAPEDYTTLLGYNVTFAANESNKCIDVVIKDDNVTEYNETFYIKMTTNNPNVMLSENRKNLTVVIINDDQEKAKKQRQEQSEKRVIVDKKAITITVKETEDIKLNCTLEGEDVTWRQSDGTKVILSNRIKIVNNILIISNATSNDAGSYVCSKDTPQGKTSYQVNLRVNVTIKVQMGLRILNWNFTKAYEDKASVEYKTFVSHFEDQMKIVYEDLEGYVGVEIVEIFNGSLRVRFRVIVVIVVKQKTDSVTGRKVKVTQRVVVRARKGRVEKLIVDQSPEFLELYNNPPPSPENVTVVEVLKDGAEITFDQPLYHEYYFIKGYFIEYWKFSSANKEKTATLPGQRIKLIGLDSETAYVARIVAENTRGIRGEESKKIDIKTKASKPSWFLAVILTCVILLILIIVIIFVYYHRKNAARRKKFRDLSMKRIEKDKQQDNVYPKSYVNTMFIEDEKCPKFKREELVLLNELGSGEFGVVHKGQLLLNGETKECAAKTLKGNVNPEDYRDLYQELDIMAHVGYHPNLVNLIGSCIEDEKLFVIVEFARNGSLIDFVRKARTQPQDNSEFELNYTNRLSISLGVAKGMAHLAQKRCVHRDLAARNVLLADNFVAKVADFGLSRDIYETGEYEKTTAGKLPTKWMAIESLELRRFTLQSDVWSFGVLLWEIETKGLMPHGAISFTELLDKQKKGYRLEQPVETPDELYRLMQMCWQANPQLRPTFIKICDILEGMLSGNLVSGEKPKADGIEVLQRQEDHDYDQSHV